MLSPGFVAEASFRRSKSRQTLIDNYPRINAKEPLEKIEDKWGFRIQPTALMPQKTLVFPRATFEDPFAFSWFSVDVMFDFT